MDGGSLHHCFTLSADTVSLPTTRTWRVILVVLEAKEHYPRPGKHCGLVTPGLRHAAVAHSFFPDTEMHCSADQAKCK